MRILVLISLLFPIVSSAQVFNRFWTPDFIEFGINDSVQAAGTIDGDTIFLSTPQKDGIVISNLRAQFYLKKGKADSFRVEVFTKNANLEQDKPNYINHCRPDSLLFLRTSTYQGQNDSSHYYLNGQTSRRVTLTDSSYSIYESDSLHENWYSKYFERGILISKNTAKDTVVYGSRARLSYQIKKDNDTTRYALIGNDGRVYKQVLGYKMNTHFIDGDDTVFIQRINGDTVKISTYTPDSILVESPSRSGSFSISESDRITKSNTYKRYYQGNLVEQTITLTTEGGHERKSYDVVDGKMELTFKETVTPFRTEQKYYKNGKLQSRNISEWDGEGGLLKNTVWKDGKKEEYLPEDLIVSGPRHCGAAVINRQNFNPLIDSAQVIVGGKHIDKPFYNEIFIKVGNEWLDLELFEDYLIEHFKREFSQSQSGFEISFSKNEKGKAKITSNFKWGILFKDIEKPVNFSYGIQLNEETKPNIETDLTIYFGYYPFVRNLNKFEDRSSL